MKLLNSNKDGNERREIVSEKNAVLAVAGVTMANGGDTIGIFISLFAVLSWTDKSLMIFIFIMMTFVWCMIAKYLVKHPRALERYGHIVTPFVLIILGNFILHESGTLGMIEVQIKKLTD